MLLKELLSDLTIEVLQGTLDVDIRSVAYDSRKTLPGSLFVCIDGFSTDGHQYAQSAIDNGAVCLVVQKPIAVFGDITIVKVADTRHALAMISAAWFGHPSKEVSMFGITGTKGKTTTTYMLASILENAGKLPGIIGTVANCVGAEKIPARRTTPESYDLQELFDRMKDKGADAIVMEVSSQGLKLSRVDAVRFHVGVFTNLSKDHIGGFEHPDMDDYFKSKLILFSRCDNAVVNTDSPHAAAVIAAATCPVTTFGIDAPADVMALDIHYASDRVSFRVHSPWYNGLVHVSVPGRFSVYNALAAISAAGIAGLPFEAVQAGLGDVHVPGRAEVVPTPGLPYTVMIDYAHTADSLENILQTVKAFVTGRLISVFGCGGDRDRSKRPQMGEVSGRIADYTVITSDNPRTEDPAQILKDIEAGIIATKGDYMVILDRTAAIREAMKMAGQGDVIVLAGKGHETYQMFKDKTIHYDEREVVEELMKELE